MSQQVGRAPLTSTPRPRDRKQQIVAAAGDLFYRHGYHNVATGQIARHVGITAGALYRHFTGKQDLLAHALIDVFTEASAVVQDESTVDLDDTIAGLAATAGRRRDLGVLWNREARHLDDDRRAAMRAQFFAFFDRFSARLAATRPDLSTSDTQLLSWCALGVLTSPSYHRTAMDSDAMIDLLRRITVIVCATPLATADPVLASRDRGSGLQPQSRRESILAASTRLFYERGYQAVTMDDIGAAVGMTGAGVYKYFASKAELLSSVIARASEPLQLGLTRALATAADSTEGLVNALDAYVEFASEHHDLVGILVAEVTNLPDDQRRSVRRAQHDYVAEWVRLLCESRTELNPQQARFVVHAVLTIVNDATRTSSLLDRPRLNDELRLIGRRILAVDLS